MVRIVLLSVTSLFMAFLAVAGLEAYTARFPSVAPPAHLVF